ncbi:acetyltransferase [Massilia sp. Root418]|nr:acetyltransferase [Massilia sp. Root418]
MRGALQVHAADPGSPEALLLMAELSAVLAAITGDSGQSSFDADDVRGPLARFAVARNGHGEAVGCGAFRPLEQGVAEVKRMYARHGHGGQGGEGGDCAGGGIGSAVLAFLEQEAAALGYQALRLSTRRVNTRAVAFYAARGYRVIPNFGRYAVKPESICFEKRL